MMRYKFSLNVKRLPVITELFVCHLCCQR